MERVIYENGVVIENVILGGLLVSLEVVDGDEFSLGEKILARAHLSGVDGSEFPIDFLKLNLIPTHASTGNGSLVCEFEASGVETSECNGIMVEVLAAIYPPAEYETGVLGDLYYAILVDTSLYTEGFYVFELEVNGDGTTTSNKEIVKFVDGGLLNANNPLIEQCDDGSAECNNEAESDVCGNDADCESDIEVEVSDLCLDGSADCDSNDINIEIEDIDDLADFNCIVSVNEACTQADFESPHECIDVLCKNATGVEQLVIQEEEEEEPYWEPGPRREVIEEEIIVPGEAGEGPLVDDDNSPSLLSRITGAVIGAAGTVGWAGIALFALLLLGIGLVVYTRRK